MISFIQTTIDGLLVGASYALIGLGFALIFGVVKRINLAYGSCLLFGAALGVSLQQVVDYGPVGLMLVTLLGCAVASLYVECLCFGPHTGKNAAITSMVASFAIWMQLDEISAKLLPLRTHSYSGLQIDSTELGPFILRTEQIFQLAIALLLLTVVFFIIKKTSLGLQIEAMSENRELAHVLGINTHLVGSAIFTLAAFVGGLGTFLILSSDGHVTPLFGLWSTFKGLVAVMIGGLGSLPGAVLGGLILGVLETHVAFSFGVEYRDIVTFGLLFFVLIVKPSGLMGSNMYRTDQLAKGRF